MEHTTRRLPAEKNIALVAHDNQKFALVEWCQSNKQALAEHDLYGTGTTANILSEATGLPITALFSGPMGGDLQLGAMIAEQKIDILIFFWDPLNAVPHDPDVKALLRISTVWNIPVAMNSATADCLIHSHDFSQGIDIAVPDYDAYIKKRLDTA